MIDFIINNRFIILGVLLVVIILMSLVTLLIYKIDKEKAKKDKWRIKEKTLLLFPWLFGSLGGMLGLYVIRHKTKHWYFVLNNWLAFLIQIGIIVGVILVK